MSQTYRDTSLFISRGLTGPDTAGPSNADGSAIVDDEVRPLMTAAGGLAGESDLCAEWRIPEWSAEATRAVALGRLARCLEKTGQLDDAEEVRREQAALHRMFGSILFPASYYREGLDQAALVRVGAGDPVEECVRAIEDGPDPTDCPTCPRPIALTNACDLSVEVAYCVRDPAEEGPIASCVQYRSLGPGEAIVIVAGPGVVTSPIVSFRSTDERESWVRSVDRSQ